MKTLERYIKRIAIPVIVVAFIAVTGNMIYHLMNKQPELPENQTSGYAPGSVGAPPSSPGESEDFTEQKLESEISALQRTLVELEQATPEETAPQVVQLKKEAQNKVKTLQSANPSNWVALRDDAYQTVQNYAEAVGKTSD